MQDCKYSRVLLHGSNDPVALSLASSNFALDREITILFLSLSIVHYSIVYRTCHGEWNVGYTLLGIGIRYLLQTIRKLITIGREHLAIMYRRGDL